MKTKKVLFIDDSTSNLLLFKVIADKLNSYEFYYATTPSQTYNLVRGIEFDLIISDYKMPLITGMDLHKEIVALGKNPPFVILTAFASKELTTHTENNLIPILEKKTRFDELESQIKDIIKTYIRH